MSQWSLFSPIHSRVSVGVCIRFLSIFSEVYPLDRGLSNDVMRALHLVRARARALQERRDAGSTQNLQQSVDDVCTALRQQFVNNVNSPATGVREEEIAEAAQGFVEEKIWLFDAVENAKTYSLLLVRCCVVKSVGDCTARVASGIVRLKSVLAMFDRDVCAQNEGHTRFRNLT